MNQMFSLAVQLLQQHTGSVNRWKFPSQHSFTFSGYAYLPLQPFKQRQGGLTALESNTFTIKYVFCLTRHNHLLSTFALHHSVENVII